MRTSDARFPAERDWINKKFCGKPSRFPVVHCYENVQYDSSLQLYSSAN